MATSSTNDSKPVDADGARTSKTSSMTGAPSTALARRDRRIEPYVKDPHWQRLWLRIESEAWRSLAFIPVDDFSPIEVVSGLASIAWYQRSAPVVVADLRTIGLAALARARDELRRRIDIGERVLIAMHSLEKSPITATIARDTDKVLLGVRLGRTSRAQVRDAVQALGAQRCLGAVVVRTKFD